MVKGYGKGKFKSDAQRKAVFSKLNKPKQKKKRTEKKLESFSSKTKTKKRDYKFYKWVESVLINDEYSTNKEMEDYFMKEGNMSSKEADFYIRQRDEALSKDIDFVFEKYSSDPRPKYNPKKRWVSTGGWRGYNQSAYAVAGSSDTGMWSDSPCPSNEVNTELKDFQKYLGNKGIKTNIRNTESSNAFMIKRWVVVDNPDDFVKAKELTKKYLKKKELELQYIHESD